MATVAKRTLEWVPMTAEELLSIRGTPEFDAEYKRQLNAIAEHQRRNGIREIEEFTNWNVPGWTYDAEL